MLFEIQFKNGLKNGKSRFWYKNGQLKNILTFKNGTIDSEGSDQLTLDTNGNTTFAGSVTATSLDINGNADVSGNITTNGDITIDNASGDPFLKFKTTAQEYVIRIDQSDSEKFHNRASG
jgi:hypothetical protein